MRRGRRFQQRLWRPIAEESQGTLNNDETLYQSPFNAKEAFTSRQDPWITSPVGNVTMRREDFHARKLNRERFMDLHAVRMQWNPKVEASIHTTPSPPLPSSPQEHDNLIRQHWTGPLHQPPPPPRPNRNYQVYHTRDRKIIRVELPVNKRLKTTTASNQSKSAKWAGITPRSMACGEGSDFVAVAYKPLKWCSDLSVTAKADFAGKEQRKRRWSTEVFKLRQIPSITIDGQCELTR